MGSKYLFNPGPVESYVIFLIHLKMELLTRLLAPKKNIYIYEK